MHSPKLESICSSTVTQGALVRCFLGCGIALGVGLTLGREGGLQEIEVCTKGRFNKLLLLLIGPDVTSFPQPSFQAARK